MTLAVFSLMQFMCSVACHSPGQRFCGLSKGHSRSRCVWRVVAFPQASLGTFVEPSPVASVRFRGKCSAVGSNAVTLSLH